MFHMCETILDLCQWYMMLFLSIFISGQPFCSVEWTLCNIGRALYKEHL